jgi:hypothetical protein
MFCRLRVPLMAARRLREFVRLSIIGRFEAQLRSAHQELRHPPEPGGRGAESEGAAANAGALPV